MFSTSPLSQGTSFKKGSIMKMTRPRMSKPAALAAMIGMCVAAWSFNASAALTNLALHKTVVVSSNEDAVGMPGSNIVDGDTLTRWGSAFSDSQWAYVDLGAVTTFDSIALWWEHSNAVEYMIQTSNTATSNDQGWTTLVHPTNDTTTIANDPHYSVKRTFKLATPSNARYLKIRCIKRHYAWGYSIHELFVYNTQGVTPPVQTNLALHKPAVGSSYESAGVGAALAVDGDTTWGSRWGSAYNIPNPDSAWWYVDLGATYAIDSISIQWEHSGAHLFYLQTLKAGVTAPDSNDGGWTTFHTDSTSYDTPRDRCYNWIKVQPTVNTRYLRLRCVKRIFTYGYGLIEFRAFGTAVTSVLPTSQKQISASGLTLQRTKEGVSLKTSSSGALSADIFSVSGKLVNRITGKNSAMWNYRDFSGRSVMNGTYLLRVTAAGKTVQDKITVSR